MNSNSFDGPETAITCNRRLKRKCKFTAWTAKCQKFDYIIKSVRLLTKKNAVVPDRITFTVSLRYGQLHSRSYGQLQRLDNIVAFCSRVKLQENNRELFVVQKREKNIFDLV